MPFDMAGEEPLLRSSSPQSSTRSQDREEEEDALLTGRPTSRSSRPQSFWRQACLFTWAMLATIAVIILAVVYQHEQSLSHSRQRTGGWGQDGKPTGKRNMIFMVSDGMGPTSLTLTRSFVQFTQGLPWDETLILDQHLIGSSRTRSTSSLITDSAAGATAFSCGKKSYNGAISVLPNHSPCGTVLEAAKKAGYLTGLVVTTRITDATPACFASHVNRREYEDLIAEQMIGDHPLGPQVDLLIGGGRCHFLPNTTSESCRADPKDIVQKAKDGGFNYIDNRKDFDALTYSSPVKLPLLALLARTDIPYEIDRVHQTDVYPSEAEMATLALRALSAATKDHDKGFFIMIEGSRIDHAGHANDPAAQVHEVLAHDSAFAAALEFLNTDQTEGILVSTSDHETGGLSTARQLTKEYPHYKWYPGVLANASQSSEFLGSTFAKYKNGDGKTQTRQEQQTYVREQLLESMLRIKDASDEEVDSVLDAEAIWPPAYIFADMISRRAQVGWSSHGHSAVDVNIYASSPSHAPHLVGNHENTDVGNFIAEYLDLDIDSVTQDLKEKGIKTSVTTGGGGGDGESDGYEYGWMGPPSFPGKEEGDALVTLDAYHGDFKLRKREAEADCGCGIRH